MFLHTGGADGSDHAFALIASNNPDCRVLVHSFAGHRVNINRMTEEQKSRVKVVIHSKDELSEGFSYIDKASKVLKRHLPMKEYVMNLLLRNYFQIKDSEYVFAVAPLQNNRMVKGGTGWAVEMAIQQKLPVVVFSDSPQTESSWYYFSYKKQIFQKTHGNPPQGFLLNLKQQGIKNVTGIGTRELSEQGREAIRMLFP